MSKKKLINELLEVDFRELADLANQMKKMARTVAQFPDDIQYTSEMLATLEDARHEAFRLTDECETAIKVFRGQ